MARRTRQKDQLPTPYYEGYLEKRSFKDKTSRKLWTCLCGSTLFFFNDKKDGDYIEKLDLSGLISITDDGSQDRKLDAARLNLQMKDGNIKLTVPNSEARELWKGYIQSVAELSVPPFLNLLPGQIHSLREAVEKEKERIRTVLPAQIQMLKQEEQKEKDKIKTVSLPAATSSSPYISLQADMPACYYSVQRLEAELLLEREAKRGNLLLRPGSGGNSFAVTTRQDLGGSVFRHYKVTRQPNGGFAIDVDSPVPCATLQDVIKYLVEKTDGILIPLIIEEAYEKKISFIKADKENGEKLVEQPPPGVPPIPELEKNPQNTPKKAIMPPTAGLRKWASSSSLHSSSSSTSTTSTSTESRDVRMRARTETPGQIPPAAMSELKLKLEQKAKCL
ncbi:signal-transducing adaptor protein 1-like [Symphorus nematophorus]